MLMHAQDEEAESSDEMDDVEEPSDSEEDEEGGVNEDVDEEPLNPIDERALFPNFFDDDEDAAEAATALTGKGSRISSFKDLIMHTRH